MTAGIRGGVKDSFCRRGVPCRRVIVDVSSNSGTVKREFLRDQRRAAFCVQGSRNDLSPYGSGGASEQLKLAILHNLWFETDPLFPLDIPVLAEGDLKLLKRAAAVSRTSEGLFQPHPHSGCVLVNPAGRVVAETHQQAQVTLAIAESIEDLGAGIQGTVSAECQAVASIDARGCTAYLNLEPGDVEGEGLSVKALSDAGVKRVVVGMLHPMSHLRNCAVKVLREQGIEVSVLGTTPCHAPEEERHTVQMECFQANEALLHRVVTQKPLSVLKYAMTLDGKIAASTGHSAWVSSPMARQRVFATRALSNAVIVGGNTVRRDNPNLTTRREDGFSPIRIVMSRTMDLQADANLWKVDLVPTIVMTQRGARSSFQQELKDKGIEVVEFDFLSPSHVTDYCYERGFLQLLWECGGTLAAPAIASGAIHKVMAFVSPKIIGGCKAPSPCGDLGFVEMTQAVQVTDMEIQQVGPDVMLTGYLPSSGGLSLLGNAVEQLPSQQRGVCSHEPSFIKTGTMPSESQDRIVGFYKPWDKWGVFSNFSCHPIYMYSGTGPHMKLPSPLDSDSELWPTVEHYYQAQKFAGVESPLAEEIRQQIKESSSPEGAATIGRRAQREYPMMLRPDWMEKRVEVMREAVLAKFQSHEGARDLLLSTEECTIIESSPHDSVWGCGIDGQGENHLGKILMSVRQELRQRSQQEPESEVQSFPSTCAAGS